MPDIINFAKLSTILTQPKAIEAGVIRAFNQYGKTVDRDKSVATYVAQHSKAVVSKTNVDFFADTTDSNQDTVARPAGEHFLILAIRLLEGANGTVNATAWTEGLSTADVMNGKASVVSNGITVIEQLPLTVFTEADEDPLAGYYPLNVPLLWGGQDNLEFKASWPTAPATANQNMRVELHGLALI